MNLLDTRSNDSVEQAVSESTGLKRIQILSDLSESQIAAIRKIPSHDKAKPKAIEASRPVSNFLSQEHYDLEQQKIFRRFGVPVTVSALLPKLGSALAHDGYGVPLLLTRDKEGKVHAFLNACMHKGSKLIEDCEPHKAGKLTCPYHAWTFALDGRLVGVPREETLKNFDKSKRGLAELACREEGGLIWVMLDRNAEPDFSNLDGQLSSDLEAFDIPRMHVYGRKTFELDANWKLVQEPFLEGYHVQRLHARSVGPMFADVPNVTDVLGLNIRQISGKVAFTPECLDIEGENIHKSVTHAYLVFPNTVIVTSPYYISVMFIMPKAPGKTIVDYMMLTRSAPDNDKAKELYQRSYEMILGVFGGEDFRAAAISQSGLESGALEDLVYCGLEETIPLYYEILERFL